ncbi:hypothetical protein ACHAW5_005164 [Stephanodiscus triporus]|uniref:HSF-type DNA-binding domain-containing protein n=1 Tax=Stephanodiscus triporus TaxID=2934178 RepID=A0ABD3R1I0_9STRA
MNGKKQEKRRQEQVANEECCQETKAAADKCLQEQVANEERRQETKAAADKRLQERKTKDAAENKRIMERLAAIEKSQQERKESAAAKSEVQRKRKLDDVYYNYAAFPDSGQLFVPKKKHFPEKLMDMLDRESLSRPDVVSWSTHGRAFVIRKPFAFEKEIVPNYFKSKLETFKRQLYQYGFQRITQGPDAGAYCHELFLRGKHHLGLMIQGHKWVKGTVHKQPKDQTFLPLDRDDAVVSGGAVQSSTALVVVVPTDDDGGIAANDNAQIP